MAGESLLQVLGVLSGRDRQRILVELARQACSQEQLARTMDLPLDEVREGTAALAGCRLIAPVVRDQADVFEITKLVHIRTEDDKTILAVDHPDGGKLELTLPSTLL